MVHVCVGFGFNMPVKFKPYLTLMIVLVNPLNIKIGKPK